MADRARIVFVDDEPDLAGALAEYFSDLGYETQTASDGIGLEAALRTGPVDLVVMDLAMPGRSGFDLLQGLPALRSCAVILLTASADAVDRILGLEMGADDYLQKPVDPRELAARAAAVLGRRAGRLRQLVPFETVSADLAAARILLQGGGTEPLSAGEVALIRAFADHPHRVLSRDALLGLAPADAADPYDRAIDARIARLRRKLRTDRIETVRGQGYAYRPPWRA